MAGSMAAPGNSGVPISMLTDSYKCSHYLQYPDASKMVAVRLRTSCCCMWHTTDAHVLKDDGLPVPNCSMASSAAATKRTQRTPGWCFMEHATSSRTTFHDAGPWRMLTRRQSSSGERTPLIVGRRCCRRHHAPTCGRPVHVTSSMTRRAAAPTTLQVLFVVTQCAFDAAAHTWRRSMVHSPSPGRFLSALCGQTTVSQTVLQPCISGWEASQLNGFRCSGRVFPCEA